MHEGVGQRLSHRFARIIRNILTKSTIDYRANPHIPRDCRKCILDHGGNWANNSLGVEEPSAVFTDIAFPDTGKGRERDVQTWEKLLGERAQSHQSAECWVQIRVFTITMLDHVHAQENLLITALAEHTWMQFTLPRNECRYQRRIQILKRGLLYHFIIKSRLRLVLDHSIYFILRQPSIPITASDIGALVSAT